MSRKLLIICEETYAKSIWGKQILSGLTGELKKKRLNYIQSFKIEDSLMDNTASARTEDIVSPSSGDTVYLIGTNHGWLNYAIHCCNSHQIIPIVLCNQSGRAVNGQYHCVCADTYGLMKQIYDDFSRAVKTKIALYGVNPASISDVSRMECFLELLPDAGAVFRNNGSLEECFRSFLPHVREYDAVICVNSYAAISLVRKLEAVYPEVLGTLSIVSYAETHLSSHYNKWISFIDLNLDQYGKAALAIAEIAQDSSCLSSITITIAGKFYCTPQEHPESEPSGESENADLFYADSELIRMSRVEHLLNECSDLDRQLLDLVMKNVTYNEIADTCYLSERAVKYHIKKYMEICNVKTKPELLELLREYLI